MDNTSTIKWTFKSNFSNGCTYSDNDDDTDLLSLVPTDDISLHLILSRKLALLVIDNRICLYIQPIKGIYNIITDILSWDFHLFGIMLTHLLLYFYPS